MRIRENPIGKKAPSVQRVALGRGQRVHVKHPSADGTLCAPQTGKGRGRAENMRPVESDAAVSCYRCLKLMAINEAVNQDALRPAARPEVERLLRVAVRQRGK